jgi:CheY-like chemotaxis protein
MDDETRARVFEPFFTTKEKGKGTGLGLSTVYGIVQQSGGAIELDTALGRGTTFRISLPEVGRAADSEPAGTAGPNGAGGSVVLVVEDSEAVRWITATALRRAGYVVLEATDGETALRHCAERGGKIDLLLTDVVMPGMNGRELAEEVERAYPGVSVLYMSGYTDDAVLERGISREQVSLLQKPFTVPVLLQHVSEMLAQHKRARSRRLAATSAA